MSAVVSTRDEMLSYLISTAKKIGFELVPSMGASSFFDIMLKKKILYFIKILEDADSLTFEQSYGLRSLAGLFLGESFVIASRSGQNQLENNTVYIRYEMPVVTPETFIEFLKDNMIFAIKFKKKMFELDAKKLRRLRKEMKLSYSSLAKSLSISKETLYCYEHEKCRATEENIKKLEEFFGEPLKVAYTPQFLSIKDAIKTKFFSLEFIVSAKPFKMANRIDGSIISISFINDRRTAKKEALFLQDVKRLSNELEPAFFKDSTRAETYNGISVLNSEDMLNATSHATLLSIIREKRA